MSFADDLKNILSDQFGSDVVALTWGSRFRAILETRYIENNDPEVASVGSYSPVLSVAKSDIPSTIARGDQLKIGGTIYKIVSIDTADRFVTNLVLANA